MRKRNALIALGAALLFVLSAPAGAATLAFTGSIANQLGPVNPTAPPTPVFGGGNAIVTGPANTVSINTPALIAGTNTVTTPSGAPPAFIRTQITTLANGTGTFSAGAGFAGGFGGILQLAGQSVAFVAAAADPTGPAVATVTVPLGVIGAANGSVTTVTGVLLGLPLTVSLVGNQWTTGQVMVTEAGGMTATMLTDTGFDNRTAGGAGTLKVVSPFQVIIKNLLNPDRQVGIASMTLRFTAVPEPGTLLLLGAGVAGLAVIGRRKRA